jgi:hypothetical protein
VADEQHAGARGCATPLVENVIEPSSLALP